MPKVDYENILKTAPFGYALCRVLHDATGNPIDLIFEEINPAFVRLTGQNATQVLEQPFSLVMPQVWEITCADNTLSRCLQDGSDFNFEYFSTHLGRWFQAQTHSPQPGYLAVIFSDISDAKGLAAAEKEQREKYFQAVLDTTFDGFWMIDGQGRLTEVNEAYCRLSGYAREELLQMHIRDLDAIEAPEETKARLERIFRNGHELFETQHRRKDGTLLDLELAVSCIDTASRTLICFSRDITFRKKAERALQQSESRFRNLSDDLPAMVSEYLPDGTLTFVNKLCCEYYHLTREQLLGRCFLDLLPENSREEIASYYLALTPEHPVGVSYQTATIGGKPCWQEWHNRGIFDDAGQAIKYQAVGFDITEKKNLEIYLASERNRLQTTLDAVSGGIWEWRIPSGEMIIGEEWVRLLGYEPAELAPLSIETWRGLTHPDDAAASAEHVEAHLAGETDSYGCEMRLRHKRGFWVWLQISGKVAQRSETGEPLVVTGILLDISGRKQIEAQRESLLQVSKQEIFARKRSESMLRILLEIAEDYINLPLDQHDAAIDTALGKIGTFVEADRAFIFERDASGCFFSNTYEWCQTGIEPWQARLQQIPAATFIKGRRIYEKSGFVFIPAVEEMGADVDNDFRELLLNQGVQTLLLLPMYAGEEIVGTVGFDFISRAHPYDASEKALLSVFAQMVTNVREKLEMLKEVARSEAEATRASQAKSVFLANMSHEIRTPLNGVIGFTHLLQDTALNQTQQEYLANVHQSATTLLEIISDVLDFSKIEAGKLELSLANADLYILLKEACAAVAYPAAQKGLELILAIQPGLPQVALIDAVRLKQIIVNFLSNAVKFTSQGEIELQAGFEASDQPGVGRLTFAVRDTGIGIALEQQQALFEAFTQADPSITRRFGGTGLGLAIAELLAQKMGAQITINSLPEQGAVFSFAVETPCGPTFEPEEQRGSHRRKRIALVEDNATARQVIEEYLAFCGVEVVPFASGRTVIESLRQGEAFDMIILDHSMPGLSGLETLKIIRETFALTPQQLPAILLQSPLQEVHLENVPAHLSILRMLTKPLTPQHIQSLVQECLKLKTAANEQNGPAPKAEDKISLAHLLPRILIAEDTPVNMLLIRTQLKKMMPGVEIVGAEDGQQAVEAFRDNKIDLVLMDVQMPVMDGLEATAKIRAIDEARANFTPIISLTAGVTNHDRERCLAAGMDEFVSKPVVYAELERVLEHFLLNP
jgi:PAS domain S-box-containing protein